MRKKAALVTRFRGPLSGVPLLVDLISALVPSLLERAVVVVDEGDDDDDAASCDAVRRRLSSLAPKAELSMALSPGGLLASALNAAFDRCVDEFDFIVVASKEVRGPGLAAAAAALVSELRGDPGVSVCGIALHPFHAREPGTLTAATSPWNTFCAWRAKDLRSPDPFHAAADGTGMEDAEACARAPGAVVLLHGAPGLTWDVDGQSPKMRTKEERFRRLLALCGTDAEGKEVRHEQWDGREQ